MSIYPATYKSAAGDVWQGASDHPQVDTGLGFTCDVGVFDIVIAINRAGFQTVSSCEARSELVASRRESAALWAIPRKWVGFYHSDTGELLRFCLHIREQLKQARGWSQKIIVDAYYVPSDPFADLDYVPELEPQLIAAVQSYRCVS